MVISGDCMFMRLRPIILACNAVRNYWLGVRLRSLRNGPVAATVVASQQGISLVVVKNPA